MRSMLLAVLMLSGAVAAQAGEHETFGAGVPAGEAVPVSLAVKDLEAHAGEPRTFSGRITQVCQKEGCWAMLEDNGEAARVLPGARPAAIARGRSTLRHHPRRPTQALVSRCSVVVVIHLYL